MNSLYANVIAVALGAAMLGEVAVGVAPMLKVGQQAQAKIGLFEACQHDQLALIDPDKGLPSDMVDEATNAPKSCVALRSSNDQAMAALNGFGR